MPSPEYSLVFWYGEKNTSIISSSKIPLHSRYENADVKLKWLNPETKKNEYLDAKIVKMSDTYEDLNNTDVDNNGKVIDNSTKAFSSESQEEATNLKTKRKQMEIQQHTVKIKQEKSLSSSNSILTPVNNRKYSRNSKASKNIKIVGDVSIPNRISIKNSNNRSPSKSAQIKKNSKRTNVDENKPSLLKRCKINDDDRCSISTVRSENSVSVLKHRKELSDITEKYINSHESIENMPTTSSQERKFIKYDDILCSPSEESNNDEEEIAGSDHHNHQAELLEDAKDKTDKKKSSDDKLFFIPNVTSRLIATQKLLLASMIYSYQKIYGHDPEIDDEVTIKDTNKFQDPDILHVITKIEEITKELFIKTPEKEEIFPNSKCYFSKSILTTVHLSSDDGDCWTKFVTTLLVQIYGKYLKFMSVQGTRGNKELNKALLKAIFNAVNANRTEPIASKIFNKYVNKICSNRKRSVDGSHQEPKPKTTSSQKQNTEKPKKKVTTKSTVIHKKAKIQMLKKK